MKKSSTKPNLFVINTPYQLLNAVEAVHSLQLTNNHLLVIRPKAKEQDRFMPLIEKSEWKTVSFPTPYVDTPEWIQNLLSPPALRWYRRILHFQCMYKLSRLARRFQNVDRLFLGHYWAAEKPFMRHIANTIKYNEVCLLDDGTDTIDINKGRCTREINNEHNQQGDGSISRASVFRRVQAKLRAKYWDWHLAEVPSLTFFTVYDLETVREGDRVIRNDYRRLRSLAPSKASPMPDTVFFIGQCIADGYCEVGAHFKMLSNVGNYFAGKKIIYVAHPRESPDCINRIRQELHWDIWPSSSVIEQDLIVSGIRPYAVAGLVSSALITMAVLLDPGVEIVSFHIAPEHWLKWGDYTTGIYQYLERQDRVRVVSLSG
jgi:hypothetical protein